MKENEEFLKDNFLRGRTSMLEYLKVPLLGLYCFLFTMMIFQKA